MAWQQRTFAFGWDGGFGSYGSSAAGRRPISLFTPALGDLSSRTWRMGAWNRACGRLKSLQLRLTFRCHSCCCVYDAVSDETFGGKGGIRLPQFPAAIDESYTFAIIPCVCNGYKQISSLARFLHSLLFAVFSRRNGITGITAKSIPLFAATLTQPKPRLSKHLTSLP
jgi:hypothetical protein